MEIRINLQSSLVRFLACLAGIAICGCLSVVVLGSFITGVLADERVLPRVDMFESYLRIWPDSGRIQAKLAEARIADPDRDLSALESGAILASNLSPFDYHRRLLLATIDEAKGDPQAAETEMQTAHNLAPNNTEVAWRQANLLLRDGKFAESQDLFRMGCQSDPSLVPITMDVVWRASGENPSAVESVTPADPESRLNLAGFLVLHGRGTDAGRVFSTIPRGESLNLPNTPVFISSMVRIGEGDLARKLWAGLVRAAGADQDQLPLIWNGGFENSLQKTLNQFDWQFQPSAYANIRIDSTAAHSGSRSLKIEFLGKDTTKLDREITQQLVLQSGTHYRLQCFVKTDRLDTPEGPLIVIANQATGEQMAASAPIKPGTQEWQPLTLDFGAPAAKTGYVLAEVSVKRKPKFSYDEPTRGLIWLDDLELVIKN